MGSVGGSTRTIETKIRGQPYKYLKRMLKLKVKNLREMAEI